MLSALVDAARRFKREGTLSPTGYKPKVPKWIIDLRGGKAYVEGPYTKKELRTFPSPDRQRSGAPSPKNLKPYLLVDDARYALGKAEPGKESEARLLHGGFLDLLEEAYRETRSTDLGAVLEFLRSTEMGDIHERVGPRDLITFRVEGRDLVEASEVQEFWARYLARELGTQMPAVCGVCGQDRPVMRILPREVVILGQKCQVVSFNCRAFLSFGKCQTANAPLCFYCASGTVDALDFLTRDERHRRALVNEPGAAGLQNQIAVFWLDRAGEVTVNDRPYDLEELLAFTLTDRSTGGPPADLAQVQALLAAPWSGDDSTLRLDDAHFHLAVLSANKGRLVVREWLDVSLAPLRNHLRAFLEATRVTSSWGDAPRPLSIGTLLRATKSADPHLLRGLLRTAYMGHRPPHELLAPAVALFRLPATLQDRAEAWRARGLASIIKLVLYHGRKEATTMAELSPQYASSAYLCGRLLAILEEAQLRAAGFSLNRTLVDRFYGAASTAPAATFAGLVRTSTTAHLPEVGRDVNILMEDVMSILGEAGGFPKTLTLFQQAEFALGFYHQRAAFRAGRSKGKSSEGGAS